MSPSTHVQPEPSSGTALSPHLSPTSRARGEARPLFEASIVKRAMVDALRKLTHAIRRAIPSCSSCSSGASSRRPVGPVVVRPRRPRVPGFILAISLWLWFTVLFANFAEAMAEGRGKAQADTLRKSRQDVQARKVSDVRRDAEVTLVVASELRKGDRVLVVAGDVIPADGEIVLGVASVDESAITGESAPVIRESGGDRSAVTGGNAGAVGLDHRVG